jgi:hypothetical protein
LPPANANLDVNVLVSVGKHFVKNKDAKELLQQKYDWDSPRICFKGKTVGRATVCGDTGYEVVLDDVPAITFKLPAGYLDYLGPCIAHHKKDNDSTSAGQPV